MKNKKIVIKLLILSILFVVLPQFKIKAEVGKIEWEIIDVEDQKTLEFENVDLESGEYQAGTITKTDSSLKEILPEYRYLNVLPGEDFKNQYKIIVKEIVDTYPIYVTKLGRAVPIYREYIDSVTKENISSNLKDVEEVYIDINPFYTPEIKNPVIEVMDETKNETYDYVITKTSVDENQIEFISSDTDIPFEIINEYKPLEINIIFSGNDENGAPITKKFIKKVKMDSKYIINPKDYPLDEGWIFNNDPVEEVSINSEEVFINGEKIANGITNRNVNFGMQKVKLEENINNAGENINLWLNSDIDFAIIDNVDNEEIYNRFASENPEIVTIDENGIVSAISDGETNINLENDEVIKKIPVSVKRAARDIGIQNLNGESIVIDKSEANGFQLDTKTTPENVDSNIDITYSIENTDIATIENGKIIGKAAGSTFLNVNTVQKDASGNIIPGTSIDKRIEVKVVNNLPQTGYGLEFNVVIIIGIVLGICGIIFKRKKYKH